MLWNNRGMLVNNQHTYTYSDFEKYCHEAITPSMYHYMANDVMNHAYVPNVEMNAVNAYFNLPELTRFDMHYQELMNLDWQRKRVNIMLDTVSDDDYETHVLLEEFAHFSKEIREEEQWHI